MGVKNYIYKKKETYEGSKDDKTDENINHSNLKPLKLRTLTGVIKCQRNNTEKCLVCLTD